MSDCGHSTTGLTQEARGLDRRQLLRLAGAGGTGVLVSSALGETPAAAATAGQQRVYVVVTDGLRTDEITRELTPTLHSLRSGGTWYPTARSMPVMETIPNHVMMMTGVRPDRGGVPANKIYDRALGKTRTCGQPTDIKVKTVIQRLRARGLRTATVLSKEYLYTVFGTQASYRWEPEPLNLLTQHAPDAATMEALHAVVDRLDPHLTFVNLGDIDRVGHVDIGGVSKLPLMRRAALANTDKLLGKFVAHLKATGRWATSTIIVLADHSMDWSVATNVVSLGAPIWFDKTLRDKVEIAQNGGADLLYWTGPVAEKAAGLKRLREVVLKQAGVLSVHTPAELRLGSKAGDLVVYCKAGWRFADPTVFHNPIPGNHGHPVTAPIPFFIAGGSSKVAKRTVRTGWARTIDVAPTIGAIFGLPAITGGYDGVNRL